MPVEHPRRHNIVAVGENRCIHRDFVAQDAPNRMIARVNLRGHIFNHDTPAAIGRLHCNDLEVRERAKARIKHA